MNKRLFLSVALMIAIFAFLVCIGMSNDKQYNFDVENCVDYLRFIIEGEVEESIQCFYREENETYYLFLPAYASLNKTVISFPGADYLKCENGMDSVVIASGDTIETLNMDVAYECTFLRGEKEFEDIRLQVMQSANLPAVFIETETETLEFIEADKEYKEPGNFALFSKDGKAEWFGNLAHITGRGNDSWTRPKKSFGIKLASDADLLGMGATDHWILLSNVVDNIYIKNKITYDMAAAAEMEGAPESRFIDLYINHEYRGMYQLSEKIEIDAERIALNNLEIENAKINKDYKTAERFGNEQAKGVYLQATPGDITGGYLIERDVYFKYSEEASGFQSTSSGEYYTIKSPKYAAEAEVYYIQKLFSEMEKAVQSVNGINPDTQKSYLEYIDLDSFAQKYIIEELSKNNGGGASSSFFYKPSDRVSHKIFSGPVWDYDKAYGALEGYNANTRDLCYMTLRVEATRLFEELYRHKEFKEMVAEYWRNFYSNYLEEVYTEKIDSYYAEIEKSARMDRIRWENICYEKHNWEEENRKRIEDLKEFVAERKRFLDEVWLNNAEICTVTFIEETNQVYTSLGVIKGEKVIPIYSEDIQTMPADMYLEGWYDMETGERFDESEAIEKDIILKGKLKEREDTKDVSG